MGKVLIFGGVVMDRYYFVDRFPRRGQDGMIRDSADFVGGCAVNMAFTVKNLGGTPYIVSCIGDDDPGRDSIEYLEDNGMPTDCIRQWAGTVDKEIPDHSPGASEVETGEVKASAACRTGYCLVFVEPDGERTFLTREGCEGRFDESLIPGRVKDECNVAAVTGYYLLGSDSGRIALALEKLKAMGYAILFDPGPMVGQISADVLERVIELADVITPNWDEAAFLAAKRVCPKRGGDKGLETELWAEDVAATGSKVILTRGAGGGLVFEGKRRIAYDGVPAKMVDSTGAGDSFSGALAYGMAKGWSMEQAVALAARCAALTVAIKGPHGKFNKI